MEGKMNRREFMKVVTGAIVADSLVSFEGNEVSKEIPSEESVHTMFETLQDGRVFTQRRKINDETGVYLWEVETNIVGGTAEFGYMRKGRFSEGSASLTKIYVTFFDEDGMPEGGHDVAEYKDGVWTY